jgi:hypothetical protein
MDSNEAKNRVYQKIDQKWDEIAASPPHTRTALLIIATAITILVCWKISTIFWYALGFWVLFIIGWRIVYPKPKPPVIQGGSV